jgi:hypothetical protein
LLLLSGGVVLLLGLGLLRTRGQRQGKRQQGGHPLISKPVAHSFVFFFFAPVDLTTEAFQGAKGH